MTTVEGRKDGEPTPVGLRIIRHELERMVEHRVLGGLSDREQQRYDELTSIEQAFLTATPTPSTRSPGDGET